MTSAYRICQPVHEDDDLWGVFLLAFIHCGENEYALSPIYVFADGQIDCWEMVSFDEFKQKVRSGRVVTQLPAQATIRISSLASFTATNASCDVDAEDFILEVADEIEELNRRPTSSKRCRAAWEAYKASPSDATKQVLRRTFEAVPKHHRKYVLGDMDQRDHPLLRVLSGVEPYPGVPDGSCADR